LQPMLLSDYKVGEVGEGSANLAVEITQVSDVSVQRNVGAEICRAMNQVQVQRFYSPSTSSFWSTMASWLPEVLLAAYIILHHVTSLKCYAQLMNH
jgi:hypothetical protein